MRDESGTPQIYMVRRHPGNAFWANAMVFVGGCLEPDDHSPEMLGCCLGLTPKEAAHRLDMAQGDQALGIHIAAVRECFEEAGILVGVAQSSPLTTPARAEMRAQLLTGEVDFSTALRQRSLSIDLGELRYWDHWTTPEFEQRRYDTHFFICHSPPEQEATHDPGEASAGAWFTVEDALQGQCCGSYSLAPPTLAILHHLRDFQRVDDILAVCRGEPISATQPRPLIGAGGEAILLFPDDHRFADPAAEFGREDYVILRDNRWQYFRASSLLKWKEK